MTIKDLTNYLLKKYPLEKQEKWDSSGFSLKFDRSKKITAVVLAIDLTSEVLAKALETKSNLIITHHPFKFLKTWKDEYQANSYKKQIRDTLKKNHISVLSMHTNYDNDIEGTSHQIVKALNLSEYEAKYYKSYPTIVDYLTTPKNIAKKITTAFGYNAFRSNLNNDELDSPVKRIAFCSGSGAMEDVIELVQNKCDLIVTSDIKWNEWITYKEMKISILEIPHLDEQVFVDHIANVIKKYDSNIEVIKQYIDLPYSNIELL